MSKMFKVTKVGVVLLIIMMIFSLGNTTSYANNGGENTEVSIFFKNFINEAFSDINKLRVKNHDGEDVTDYFLNKTITLFEKEDYKAIREIIINEELVPSIRKITDIENNIDLMRASRTQTFSDYEYKNEAARNGFGRLEWTTLLTGTVTYDPNTGQILSAPNPSIHLHYTGGGWDLPGEMSNVSTSRRIYSSYVNFSGRYKMTVDIEIIDVNGVTWLTVLDFGTHVHSFDAYPDF
ncbi:hypothetical protein KQI38_20805 [Tissierella carlieri]|uniref:hypothetical protein n=1 Tax=Tissierella carlieri TaxID=689904 RepID=UPI001C116748|nr:hypothetical protein [Tissierella carlieri]MBU5314469.1 hypothetical protein [Tissierella carlieri]